MGQAQTNIFPQVPRPIPGHREGLAHLKGTGCGGYTGELGHALGFGPIPRSPGVCGTARPEPAGHRGSRQLKILSRTVHEEHG